MLGTIGIFLGFAVLLVAVWRKYNLILAALVSGAVIGLTNGFTLAETWNTYLVQGIASFGAPYFWMLVIGALFAKLMEDSNATKSLGLWIADRCGEKYSLLGYMVVTGLLTLGGVNGFVIIFVLLPLAKVLFRKGNVPWYIFPAVTYAAMVPGCAFFPGGIQTNNMAPTNYLGTTLTAAPWIGVIGTVLYLAMVGVYVYFAVRKGRKNPDAPEYYALDADTVDLREGRIPSALLSIIPLAVALVCINLLKLDIVYGLLLACLSCLVLFWKYYDNLKKTLNDGVFSGVSPVIMVCMVVGIARVVAATPAFASFQEWLLNLPFSGLFKVFAVTNAVAFMTGSGTAAISTTLELFGQDFLAMGFSPEVIHRVVAMSSEGFDSMPWNNFIVLVLTMAGLSYSRSYKHVFVCSVLLTILATLLVIAGIGIFA